MSVTLVKRSRGDISWEEEDAHLRAQKSTIAKHLLTCNLHLSVATVFYATGGDGLLLQWDNLVVFVLFWIYLLNMMIITKLRQLSFEIFVLSNRIKTLDMIYSVHPRHLLTLHSFPFVVVLNLCWTSWPEVKVPMWRCFWFTATSCFYVSKKNKIK